MQKKIISYHTLFLLLYSYSFLIPKIQAPKEFFSQDTLSWAAVCKKSEDAVCQIFCCTFSPNFQEPYLSHERSGGCRGTGFCITTDGFILTNYHVIDRAIATFIQFPFGRDKYKAEYIGGCQDYDIALLKLTSESLAEIEQILSTKGLSKELPYIPLGDSDTVSGGQKIAAIGYPLGHENIKISSGICSGREEITGDRIQTTIPINGGNSGGPVFDKTGHVIGISSSKMVSKSVEGVAFIIPINNIKALLPALLASAVVRAPFWGVSFADLTPETLDYFKKSHPLSPEAEAYFKNAPEGGVLVTRVKKMSLFASAQIQKGDILLAINNLTIDHHGYLRPLSTLPLVTLHNYLSRLPLEDSMTITYLRAGEIYNVDQLIKQPPHLAIDEWSHWSQALPEYEIIGGLVFSQLSINLLGELAQLAFAHRTAHQDQHASTLFKYGKIKNRVKPRVCLSACLPNSQAYRSLNRLMGTFDCIIKKINGQKIHTIYDVRKAIIDGAHNPYLVIESEGGIITALPLNAIIKEEESLGEQYGYEPTATFREIKNVRQQMVNQDDGQT